MPAYYPVYLDLRGRLAIVVGGGAVGEEKVDGLVDAGARVRVIAPRLTPAMTEYAVAGTIEHVPRAYRTGDLEGAFIVLAERLGTAIQRAVWAEAERLGIPTNVQDDTPRCSFIAPSIVRRGDLTVAISTAGKAPVLAVRLRQQLESLIGRHHERFIELAGRLRAAVGRRHPAFETRRKLWYRLVDSDVLSLLEAGEDRSAEATARAILKLDSPSLEPAVAQVEVSS